MRPRTWLPLLLSLAACSSIPSFSSTDSSKLTLKNTQWKHVNVQVVITKSANCDERGEEFIGSQDFVLQKDQTRTIVAPDGANVCWRRDRYPSNPTPDVWSGWYRAVMYPGNDISSEV